MADLPLAGRMERAAEVAAFVDFENIRYSTINSYGQEPDPVSGAVMTNERTMSARTRANSPHTASPCSS